MIRYILVDDDDSTLDYVKRKIDSISQQYDLIHVDSYSSSKKALETIHPEDFDLLIVDFEMPVYNGIELAQKVAINKKVIFLTSTINNERKIINAVDIAGYLSKPFDLEEFEVILKNKIINTVSPITIPETYTISIGTTKTIQIRLKETYYISTSKSINGYQPKPNHVNFYGKDDILIFENIRITIKDLAKKLEALGFNKINQSTIINKYHLKTIDNIHVALFDSKESFELSQNDKENFKI